jgi:hypothetical protein
VTAVWATVFSSVTVVWATAVWATAVWVTAVWVTVHIFVPICAQRLDDLSIKIVVVFLMRKAFI